MELLLKEVKIISPASKHHLKKRDILIKKGVIAKIASSIKNSSAKSIPLNGKSIAAGFIDMNCQIGDPGFEYREDIHTGLKAATKGGFTSICYMPNTYPTIDTKPQVEYIKNTAKNNTTRVFPIGSISKKIKGKSLAELYDMHSAGALAFSDGNKAIQNAGLLERALLYVKKFNGLVITHPDTESISLEGNMNEGEVSTSFGMKASPALAEELMIARDIYLLEHTQSRLHIANISTEKSVELVKKAKKDGLNITCGVNVANLLLDDSTITDFDTNYKVNPHLRTKKDVKALIKGLKNGVVDVINSGHTPLHIDEKKVEFDKAKFGMSTLEATFSIAVSAVFDKLSIEELIEKFTENPATILGFKNIVVEEGEKAIISIFSEKEKTVYSENDWVSKSTNFPLFNKELKGKIVGVVNKNKSYWL